MCRRFPISERCYPCERCFLRCFTRGRVLTPGRCISNDPVLLASDALLAAAALPLAGAARYTCRQALLHPLAAVALLAGASSVAHVGLLACAASITSPRCLIRGCCFTSDRYLNNLPRLIDQRH